MSVYLLQHEVPECEWTVGVNAREDVDYMGLVGLDGFLSNVASVLSLGHKFVLHFVLANGLFEFVRAFIVQDMFLWLDVSCFEFLQQSLLSSYDFACRSIPHCFA